MQDAAGQRGGPRRAHRGGRARRATRRAHRGGRAGRRAGARGTARGHGHPKPGRGPADAPDDVLVVAPYNAQVALIRAVARGCRARRGPGRHGRQVPGPGGPGHDRVDDRVRARGRAARHGLPALPEPRQRGGLAGPVAGESWCAPRRSRTSCRPARVGWPTWGGSWGWWGEALTHNRRRETDSRESASVRELRWRVEPEILIESAEEDEVLRVRPVDRREEVGAAR